MKTINSFKDHAPRPRPRAVQEAVEHQDEMKVRAALSDLFASCETTSEVEDAIEYIREAIVDAFNDAECLGGPKEVKIFGDAFKPLRFNVRGQNVYMLR